MCRLPRCRRRGSVTSSSEPPRGPGAVERTSRVVARSCPSRPDRPPAGPSGCLNRRMGPDRRQTLLDDLRTLILRHAGKGGTEPLGCVMVSVVGDRGEPAPATSGTTMALIAQGAKRLALGDRVHEYRAGQYLVASVDLPVTGQFTQTGPAQ